MSREETPEDASNDLRGPTDERDRGLGIVVDTDGSMRQLDARPDVDDADPEE